MNHTLISAGHNACLYIKIVAVCLLKSITSVFPVAGFEPYECSLCHLKFKRSAVYHHNSRVHNNQAKIGLIGSLREEIIDYKNISIREIEPETIVFHHKAFTKVKSVPIEGEISSSESEEN